MMTGPERQHFDMLREGPCASPEYIKGYYGLTWPQPDEARGDFEAWAARLRPERRPDCPSGWESRYEIESFMQQKNFIPKKWMGAQLGMSGASLEKLLGKLQEIQMRRQLYEAYSELMIKSFDEDLIRNLPGMKFRTFRDHNDFCEHLHRELQNELGIVATPLLCATSERLEENPKQFASNFDCLTLEPVSPKHQMWLDFPTKPLYLGPDRCSKLFYVEHREELRSFRAGSREPEYLDRYEQFLTTSRHA